MNIEDAALTQVKSIDEILEDVHLSRARHRDVINCVDMINKALEEMKAMRQELSELKQKQTGN